jgi:hypothetical protein
VEYSGVQTEYKPGRGFRSPKTIETGRKDQEKSPFPAENLQKSMGIGSSIPGRKIFGIFRRLLAVSHWKEQEFGQKTLEKPEIFPTLNTTSKPHRFPELFGRIRLVRFN